MKNSSWLLVHFPIKLTKNKGENASAVVMSTSGAATYQASPGSKQKLETGAVVALSGTLELGAGAEVKLFYDGATHTLNKAGTYPLTDTLTSKAPVTVKRGGFAQKFGDELILAFAGGDKTGGTGSGIGWGKKEHEAVPIAPVDTAVPPGPVTFTWFPPAGNPSYRFQLFHTGKAEAVFTTDTKNTSVDFDLSTAGANKGDEFYWTVAVGAVTSEKAFFTIGEAGAGEASLQQLQQESVYQNASAAEKKLMEAVALSDARLTYHAFQALSGAKAAFPNDKLVQGMYDNFVRRMVER